MVACGEAGVEAAVFVIDLGHGDGGIDGAYDGEDDHAQQEDKQERRQDRADFVDGVGGG